MLGYNHEQTPVTEPISPVISKDNCLRQAQETNKYINYQVIAPQKQRKTVKITSKDKELKSVAKTQRKRAAGYAQLKSQSAMDTTPTT